MKRFLNAICISLLLCAQTVSAYPGNDLNDNLLDKNMRLYLLKLERICSRITKYYGQESRRFKIINNRLIKNMAIDCVDYKSARQELKEFSLGILTLRDELRMSSITQILNALQKYLKLKEALPIEIPENETFICQTNSSNCKGMVDLSFLTGSALDPNTLIVSIPFDTTKSTRESTGYTIKRDKVGVITISAPFTEGQSTPLSVSSN